MDRVGRQWVTAGRVFRNIASVDLLIAKERSEEEEEEEGEEAEEEEEGATSFPPLARALSTLESM